MVKKQIAVVGFGFMGITHLTHILANEHLELKAIVTRNPFGIEKKLSGEIGNFDVGKVDAGQLATVNRYDNLTDCLATESLDAVYLCVHTDLHYSMACMALAAGVSVFLEKPMVLDVSQGEELIALAKNNNCILMVGHVLRFMSPYQKLKRWVDNGTYGNLRFLSLSRFSGLPSWGQWKEKQADHGATGGALFDLLIHDIDYASYLLGKPDAIESRNLPGQLSDHDYTTAWWTYHEKNLKVKLEGGNIFHSMFPFEAGFVAAFEKASIRYSTTSPDHICIATHDRTEEIPANDEGDGFLNETKYFAHCLVENAQPEVCLPASSLETIRLCYEHIAKD